MNIERLKQTLISHEGMKLTMYKDTVGKWTIGVGRNIEDIGLRPKEALYLLQCDIDEATAQLDAHMPWWRGLSDVRQEVLVDMCFMGINRLMGFVKMIAALQSGNWSEAATEMLDSEWAKEVGKRAVQDSRAMLNDEWDSL